MSHGTPLPPGQPGLGPLPVGRPQLRELKSVIEQRLIVGAPHLEPECNRVGGPVDRHEAVVERRDERPDAVPVCRLVHGGVVREAAGRKLVERVPGGLVVTGQLGDVAVPTEEHGSGDARRVNDAEEPLAGLGEIGAFRPRMLAGDGLDAGPDEMHLRGARAQLALQPLPLRLAQDVPLLVGK